jgi:hypothetical protein
MDETRGKIVLGRQNNEAHPREAAVGSKYTVIRDLVERRQRTKTGFHIGESVSRANVSMRQHELAVGFKTVAAWNNPAPPSIFTSFTGYAPKSQNQTKYEMRKNLFLAGRLDAEVDYEGAAPAQEFISVQKGGVTSIRYYNFTDQHVAHGTYLIWDVPDPEPTKLAPVIAKFRPSRSAHQPAGMLPVEVRPLSHEELRELPIFAFRKFIANPGDFLDMNAQKDWYIKDFNNLSKKDAIDRYIVHGLILPCLRGFAAIENKMHTFPDKDALTAAIVRYNAGLAGFASDATTRATLGSIKAEIKLSMENAAMLAMGAQYDAWMDVWSRCFGMALNVGHNSDLVKVIMRP